MKGRYSFALLLFGFACLYPATLTVVRRCFGMLLPFIIAAITAICLRRPSLWLSARIKISARSASMLLLLGLIVGMGVTAFMLLNRLTKEWESLLGVLSRGAAMLGDALSMMSDLDSPLFNALYRLGFSADSAVGDAISSLIKALPLTVISAASALPTFLLSLVVTVVSAFYLCIDYEGISRAITHRLSPSVRERLSRAKSIFSMTLLGYMRSCGVLLLITLSLLWLGLSVLGVGSPFAVSLLVALVDLLPIVGVGAVLIPWGLLRLILYRDLYLGVGLLILYAVTVTVRQLAEPKILGRGVGLHPLAALFASFVGFRVFGIVGMVLSPILASMIKSLFLDRDDIDKIGAL